MAVSSKILDEATSECLRWLLRAAAAESADGPSVDAQSAPDGHRTRVMAPRLNRLGMLRKSMQVQKRSLWWHASHVVSFSKPLKISGRGGSVVGQRDVGYSEQMVTARQRGFRV